MHFLLLSLSCTFLVLTLMFLLTAGITMQAETFRPIFPASVISVAWKLVVSLPFVLVALGALFSIVTLVAVIGGDFNAR